MSTITTAAERINAICKIFNTNPKRLAEDLNYDSPSTLYHVVNGSTKEISPKMIEGLLKLYPTVSKMFLVGVSKEPLLQEEVINPETSALILQEMAEIKKLLNVVLKQLKK